MTHADALRFAKLAAPLLDLGVTEFMRQRRNKSSRFFEPAEEPFTVTVFAEFSIVEAALLLNDPPLDSAQEPASRLIEQVRVTLCFFRSADFHLLTISKFGRIQPN